MNTYLEKFERLLQLAGTAGLLAAVSTPHLLAATSQPSLARLTVAATADAKSSARQKKITVEPIAAEEDEESSRKDVTWLGVGAEESSEAMAAQLGLKPGQGLLITYVPEDGPAAKAGVQKNDVLVQLDDQIMLLPTQLRKLVQMHKVGDQVKLTVYRNGDKKTLAATLGKAPKSSKLLGDPKIWRGDLNGLQWHLKELPLGDSLRLEMKDLQDSLARSGLDKESLKIEIQRSLEAAHKAAQEALRNVTNSHHYGATAKMLENLARNRAKVEKDAKVTVNSGTRNLRTMVTTDDDGSYVIVANPKKYLTAHGKDGKLVFDGEIETPEQQEKVPRDVWDKVKPMLSQMDPVENDKNP